MFEQDSSYIIKFDIPKDKTIKTSDFVDGMREVLLSLEDFNNAIVQSISKEIEVVSYIEELSAGSIKYKLRDVLIDHATDKNIEKFIDKPIKTTFASVIKSIKKLAITLLSETEKLPLEERKMKIITLLKKEIEQYDAENLIIGVAINEEKLLQSLSRMSVASNKLHGNCSFFYDDEKEIRINSNFDMKLSHHATKADPEQAEAAQYINGHITVYAPIFDAEKTKWKFLYNKNIEIIDISKTNIANFILKRGKVVVGDCFKVKLEIIEKKLKVAIKTTIPLLKFWTLFLVMNRQNLIFREIMTTRTFNNNY